MPEVELLKKTLLKDKLKLTEKIYRPVFILFTLTPPQILYNEKSFFQKKNRLLSILSLG